eukprot:3482391-Prymnesium_polylepis.1
MVARSRDPELAEKSLDATRICGRAPARVKRLRDLDRQPLGALENLGEHPSAKQRPKRACARRCAGRGCAVDSGGAIGATAAHVRCHLLHGAGRRKLDPPLQLDRERYVPGSPRFAHDAR